MSTIIKKGHPPINASNTGYTPDELKFLITTLGEQHFKIKDIEFIYNLIVKLQEDYLSKKDK